MDKSLTPEQMHMILDSIADGVFTVEEDSVSECVDCAAYLRVMTAAEQPLFSLGSEWI